MRAYKTNYKTHRGVSRFHVELPYETEPEPNSEYWQKKLDAALDKIVTHPALITIWDSALVPEKATYKEHAEMAIRLAGLLESEQLTSVRPMGEKANES